MTPTTTLTLTLSEAPDDTPEELDREVMRLRRELLFLQLHDVRMAHAAGPEGVRGADAVQIGALVVTLAPTVKLLGGALDVVRQWLRNQAGRTVKVEMDGDVIEISGAARDDVRHLVDAFVSRHAAQDVADKGND